MRLIRILRAVPMIYKLRAYTRCASLYYDEFQNPQIYARIWQLLGHSSYALPHISVATVESLVMLVEYLDHCNAYGYRRSTGGVHDI